MLQENKSEYNIQSGSNFEHVYNLIETAQTINQFEVNFSAEFKMEPAQKTSTAEDKR